VIITTPLDIPDAAFVTCRNGNAALLIVNFSTVFITIFQHN
jgi:hypothetical protein